jgi:hypothetical protein
MASSIARLDGPDSPDLRDRLELSEDTRDTDDDEAPERRGDMGTASPEAPNLTSGGAERPDRAARGVASASGFVTTVSPTILSIVFVLLLGPGFDCLCFLRLRFVG